MENPVKGVERARRALVASRASSRNPVKGVERDEETVIIQRVYLENPVEGVERFFYAPQYNAVILHRIP